ncbi:MAG: 3'-5' exonuclease [Bacteroidales bacterium]|nr:3'-5' exonuclease [Bacteroidales bacterium]
MLSQISLTNIIFLDIETVPQYPGFDDSPEIYKNLWEKKSSFLRKENESASDVFNRAGIYAEFGKIICISMGIFDLKDGKKQLRIKSLFGDDEKKILDAFCHIVNNHPTRKNLLLCAHNGKEFDFPYIARRMLINGIKLPEILDLAGKKPWEINLLDTMELWKFGDYKHYTSLELLASVFDIPSPKDDIDGSMVAHTYWVDKELDRIAKYCEKDVITIAGIFFEIPGRKII